ncbi:NAD(P)H-dependent glycerol-3-phosphate dehydrogenase [Pararhizobium mangrovi]
MGTIAVVGAGAFGTALATVVARHGRQVLLVARDGERAAAMERERENAGYLPGVALPQTLRPTADPATIETADAVLLAVPSQAQRATARTLAGHLKAQAPLVVCAKGFEKETGRLLTGVVAEEAPDHPVAVLSGPGFAADIAAGLPTAMTLAAGTLAEAEALSAALSGHHFRLYAGADPIGVQVGGALKNVLAIACGIVEGARLGESARAALIARGLAEITRLAVTDGARAETLAGLSGLGDLVLTATSRQSRNLRFGIALGQGAAPADLTGPGAALAEGAFTAAAAARLARERGIAMPITDAVSAIIAGRLTVAEALEALMQRPLTNEGS